MNDIEITKDGIHQKCGFLGALLAPSAASLMQPVISSVVKDISGKGVWRAGRGYVNGNF